MPSEGRNSVIRFGTNGMEDALQRSAPSVTHVENEGCISRGCFLEAAFGAHVPYRSQYPCAVRPMTVPPMHRMVILLSFQRRRRTFHFWKHLRLPGGNPGRNMARSLGWRVLLPTLREVFGEFGHDSLVRGIGG